MNQPKLFGPVPCPVAPEVLAAQGLPLQDATYPGFTRIVEDAVSAIRELCRTPDYQVFLQCSTATGVIEGALLNLTRPGDSVVVVVTGKFGERLARVAARSGLTVREVELPYGAALTDPDLVRARIDDTTRLVMAVHHETSTGAVNDPVVLREAVAGTSAMVLLDVVSSLGAVPVHGAEWQTDVLIGSSQKGLGGTPGLAYPVVSPRAMRHLAAHPARTYALDWARFAEAYDEGAPGGAFSPAMSLVYGFTRALAALIDEEETVRTARYRHLRSLLEDGLRRRDFGLRFPAGHEPRGPVVVAFPPAGTDTPAMARALARRNVSVGLGQGPVKHRAFRFALYGQTESTIADLLTELDAATELVALGGTR